ERLLTRTRFHVVLIGYRRADQDDGCDVRNLITRAENIAATKTVANKHHLSYPRLHQPVVRRKDICAPCLREVDRSSRAGALANTAVIHTKDVKTKPG